MELFFGAIRASGGSNNNPNVRQFIGAYKTLLLQNIQGGKGNCMTRDDTSILFVLGDSCTVDGQQMSMTSTDFLVDKYGMVDNSDTAVAAHLL